MSKQSSNEYNEKYSQELLRLSIIRRCLKPRCPGRAHAERMAVLIIKRPTEALISSEIRREFSLSVVLQRVAPFYFTKSMSNFMGRGHRFSPWLPVTNCETHLIALLWGLSVLMNLKDLASLLVHSKFSINGGCYRIIAINNSCSDLREGLVSLGPGRGGGCFLICLSYMAIKQWISFTNRHTHLLYSHRCCLLFLVN